MTNSYELTQLDSNSFEHMVNFLALKVLGKGVTGFAAGADGGRDGYLSGEAPYPSESERWNGTWYIQSKFHKPHLSKNSQTWLIGEVKKELEAFQESDARIIPDIWIIATNIEPSGTPQTGSYDLIKELVNEHFGENIKFDIWGGRRILDFLAINPIVASYYGHFLTPGNVLTALYNQINDSSAQIKPIINHLILDQFNDQIYTKLEQAGSSGVRPKIHELFVDLPSESQDHDDEFFILETLVATSANVHKPSVSNSYGEGWREWTKHPRRARALLLKGGPGQGKSTAGQFYSQIQRAALLLEPDAPIALPSNLEVARELLAAANDYGFKPTTPRIPISIELKDFATWYGTRMPNEPTGILSYLCSRISQRLDQPVDGGTLKRALSIRSWFLNFDGLDEVPNDVKDSVANEIIRLTNIVLPELDADVLVLCTTRPQGYSGQFQDLDAVTLELLNLPSDVAMKCASGVIKFGHTESESNTAIEVLKSAIESPQVRALMTTPLQSHIMAVVVRDGGRPPEKRWELFENFYQVMKKRETLKNFPDPRINKLLRENSALLRAIHARLGISLHASAEISKGAETTLDRSQFQFLARQTTERYVEEDVEELVETLMEATTERLVFVNTPESSTTVRFDIRQLQEFFAGEFIYSNVDPSQLRSRLETIGRDSHWREVMHFAISALIVTLRPTELAVALEVICKLDDSDQSHAIRTFKRRTGAGAILTLRLLNEGVLEEDRAVRLKFKEALTPLYAMLDSGVTSTMTSLNKPHTLSWLLNCMSDALFEYSEPEQIGAGIILARKLPDHHARCNEVSEKIFSSSVKYLNAIYKSFQRDHHAMFGASNLMVENTWFIKGTLNLILSQSPPPELDISGIIRVLRRYKKLGVVLDRLGLGLAKTESALLFTLLETFDQGKKHKQFTTKLGEITVNEFECNWKTDKIFPGYEHELNPDDIKQPLLRIVAHTISFNQRKRLSDIISAIELMITYKLNGGFLPEPVAALLPIDTHERTLHNQLKYFRNLNETQFDAILIAGGCPDNRLPKHRDLVEFGVIDTEEKLRLITESHPIYIITLWLKNYHYALGNEIDTPRSITNIIILDAIKQYPHCAPYFFASWGKIYEEFPEHEAELRNIFLSSVDAGMGSADIIKIMPFKIDIERELDLLPLLAQLLIDSTKSRHHFAFLEDVTRGQIIESYGLNSETLKIIYNSQSHSATHRAAALCCYLSQIDDGDSGVDQEFFNTALHQSLLSLCEEISDSWFLNTITFMLRSLDFNSAHVIEYTGKILHAYRTNYEARGVMQILLADWRERSEAPVTQNNLLSEWLSA
jgi:hypothetical protein